MNTPQKHWRKRTRATASAIALFIGASTALVACGNEPDDNTVAKLLPQSTIGYMSAAISPSNKQKLSLFALSKHFPSKVHSDKADEVRDKLLAEMFKDTSLNYENDVKPWLGSEAAIAMLPSYTNDHIPVPVLAVKQTDKEKAQAALDKSHQKANTYRFIDDYVFFVDENAPTTSITKALDDIEALSKNDKDSLQKNKRFQNNIDNLHGEHLVIGWLDTPVAVREGIAYAKSQESKRGSNPSTQLDSRGMRIGNASSTTDATVVPAQLDPYASLYAQEDTNPLALGLLGGFDSLSQKQQDDAYNKMQKAADEAGSFSFELYATSDSFVVEGVTEKEPKSTNNGTDKKIFNGLPNDTLGAVTVSDFGKQIQDALANYEKDAKDPSFKELQPSIDKLVGALGNEGVAYVHTGDPLAGGAVIELADANAAQTAVDELINKAKSTGTAAINDYSVPDGKAYEIQEKTSAAPMYGIDPNTGQYTVVPGTAQASGTHVFLGIANNRLSITNNGDELKAALAGNGQLGDQPLVKKALSDQKLVFGAYYLNVDQIVQLAQKKGAKLTGDSGDWLKSLDVLGTQSWVKDGHYHAELRLGLK